VLESAPFIEGVEMLLFVLWASLALGALAGAGYSHYRYRVKKNRYYAHLFAKDRSEVNAAIVYDAHRSCRLSVLTLGMVTILVPLSLLI
jgi:hypothetical protein